MVNPYTDPRYAMARLMREQRSASPASANPLIQGTPRSEGAIRLGRAANDAILANPSLESQIEAIRGGSRSQKPQGIMGTVLGNPIAKIGLNALGTLAIPGRATVAAIREGADIFDSDPNTRASFSDFKKNVSDVEFGFGKAFKIDTGSKWLDRAIGFVGDVALDPLTYATFGAGTGAAKFAGYAGRIKLAKEVLKNTGDDVLATAVARQGRSALRNNPEVLERVGANKFGVYFFGKRVKVGKNGAGLRVPMSGQIGEIGEATLAKIRLAITDTRAGKYAQKMTMDKDMLDARLKVARGLASPGEAADYIRFFDMIPRERAARGAALQAFEQQVVQLIKSEEIGGLESYRKTLHKFLENPELLASASDAERQGYNVWKTWFDQHAQNVQDGFRAIDPEADIQMRQNYFPRTLTDDAIRYTRGDGVHSEKLREVFMEDPFAKPGAFTPRTLTEGRKFFGVPLAKSDLNVERLNQIAREKGFDGDFFETDIVDAARKYIYDAADEVGIIERNKSLAESGFFKRMEEQRVTQLEVDEDAVAMARQNLNATKEVLDGVDEDFRKSLNELVTSVRAETKTVASEVVTQEVGITKIVKYLFDSKERIVELTDLIDNAKTRVAQLMGDPTGISPYALSDDFPSVAKPILDQFDSITGEMRRYQRLLDDAYEEASMGRIGLSAMDSKMAELEEAATRAYSVYSEAKESIQFAMEASNVIQANWDSIVIGTRLGASGEAHSLLKSIKDVLGTSKLSQTAVDRRRAQALGVAGSLRNFIGGKTERTGPAKYFDQVFNELAGLGGIRSVKRSKVNMTQAQFDRIVNNALTSDIDIMDLRSASLYAMARDIRLHNASSFEELPAMVREFHLSLRNILRDAGEVDQLRVNLNNRNKLGIVESLEQNLGAVRNAAKSLREDITDFNNFTEYMDKVFAPTSTRFASESLYALPLTENIIKALEIGMREYGRSGAGRKSMPWLYDYLENPEIALNKAPGEQATLGDVLEAVRVRSVQIQNEYNTKRITVSATESQANLRVGTEFGGQREVTYSEVENMFANAEAREFGGLQVSKRLIDKAMNPEAVKAELAQGLLMYEGMSSAMVKFEAVAGMLAPYGIVPDEEMWRGVLRTVSTQYGSQFKSKVSQTVAARDALQGVREAFVNEMEQLRKVDAEFMGDVARGEIKPSIVFEGALRKALDTPEGPMIREIIGENLANFYDPFDMRRRVKDLENNVRRTKTAIREQEKLLAETADGKGKSSINKTITELRGVLESSQTAFNNYVDDFVLPWAQMTDPSRRAQRGPALTTLKNKVGKGKKSDMRELAGPTAREVGEIHIYRWFEKLFGSERNITDVWDVVGGNVDTTVSNGTIKTRGTIDAVQTQYIDAMRFFDRMSDGFLDVRAFFDDPNSFQSTPSGYAAMMDGFIRQLESAVAIDAKAVNIVSDEKTVDMLPIDALKATQKARAVNAREAVKVQAKYNRAAEIDAAFKNPDLTSEELASLGFTKQMLKDRDRVLEYNEFMGTLEYAKAQQDLEMISFLDAVSGVDFSKFNDGIVVDVKRSPIYQDVTQSAGAKTASARVEIVNTELDNLRKSLDSGREEIFRKHKKPDGTWKDPQSEEFARVEIAQWEQTYGRRIERRISALEDEAEGLSAQLGGRNAIESVEPVGTDSNGRIILGYEEQPVWATMPDGSRLTFTPEEWDSLYQKPLVALEAKNLNTRKRLLESEISESEKLLATRETASGNWTPYARSRLRQLRSSVASMKTELGTINRRLSSSTMSVRNSALEKVRILTTKQPGESRVIASWIDELASPSNGKSLNPLGEAYAIKLAGRSETDSNLNRVAKIEGKRASAQETLSYYRKLNQESTGKAGLESYVSNSFGGATGRRQGLQEMWELNPSYKILQRKEELAKAATGEAFVNAERNARMLNKALREARDLSQRSAREFDAVERTVQESIRGIRNNEFEAARLSGAQFEDSGEILELGMSIGSSIKYTLNGKQYSIPSLPEMLKNPDKYLKQATKRGDFFFDLRQKGNVVMWRDMDEQARSVAGVAALNAQVIGAKMTADSYRLNMINPTVGRVKEVESLVKAWSSDVKVLRESLDSVRQALNAEKALYQSDIAGFSDELLEARLDFFELGQEIKALYGDDFDISIESLGRIENRLATLRSQEGLLDALAKSAPTPAAGRSLMASKTPAARERWRDVFQGWVDENRETLRALGEADLMNPSELRMWDSWMRAQTAEARFIREQSVVSAAQRQLDTATEGVMIEKVIKPFEKEFSKVAKDILEAGNLRMAGDLNMPSFAVNKEVMEVLNNLSRAREGAMVRELGRFMGQYTGFFKAYATLSPGFHVRNAISNTFQLFAAGGSPVEMSRGLKLYRSMGEFMRNGGTYEDWLMTLPEGTRARARIAGDVSLALGGGNVDDAFREFVNVGRGRLVDNIATRTSRGIGRRVEGSARFMLAWDSAVRGDDFVESFNRTKRFLFDYNSPTILDETVRNVIPFWIWMSRNLPLQLVNQWANPKPYLIYQRFANNFGAGEDDVLPSYMQETGHSIKLGGALWMAPDLPHSKVRQQVGELGDPVRMMSYVNPGLRLPVELMGNRKTFNNAPFTGEYKPVDAKFMPFLPLLAAMGQVEYTQDGKPVMTEKAQYALTNALPMLGQAERLFPSTDAGDGMALARYFGLPLRRVDEDAQNNVMLGRLAEIQRLTSKNKRIDEAYGEQP